MRTIRLLILIIAVFGGRVVHAQKPPLPVSAVVPASNGAAGEFETHSVRLLVGRSTLVDVATPIARVSLTSPDVADALVTAPTQVLINGKVPGTISMFLWDRSGGIRRYEVIVQRDLARLAEQVTQLFPGESIEVQSNGRDVVLSGSVSNKDVIEKAINVAAGYVEKKEQVVTLLQVRPGGASNQVLLRVRFAEVNRNALTELGSSFFTGANGYKDVIGRATTQQFPAPEFDTKNGGLVFSDFLNLFLFDTKHQLGTVIKALQNKGLFQSLAEPNLVAESGKEASFLAGGEIPVPIAQGSGGNMAISVQYKEFGIRLSFTPVVTGNRIHLKVKPEVSTLDFSNAVTLNGFRIPALSTRRTETELELENGQTFAIAGLMNNTVNSTTSKIPGIGDIPILGLLFQSKSAQKNQTELVVMITPEILPNNSSGVTSSLPRMPEKFMPVPKQSVDLPPPAFRPEPAARQDDAPAAAAAPVAAAPKASTPDAKSAAAAMSALTPMTRPVIHAETTPKPAEASKAAKAPKSAERSSANSEPSSANGTKAMTSEEKKAIERAHKQEEAAKAAAGKEAMKQAEIDRAKQKKDAEVQAKLAKEQAKKDAEAAKRAAEEAKRQAEIDKKQQKAVSEAEVRLKAAQAEYQAEITKKQKSR
jgi:pilus assembly protein CpaC